MSKPLDQPNEQQHFQDAKSRVLHSSKIERVRYPESSEIASKTDQLKAQELLKRTWESALKQNAETKFPGIVEKYSKEIHDANLKDAFTSIQKRSREPHKIEELISQSQADATDFESFVSAVEELRKVPGTTSDAEYYSYIVEANKTLPPARR